MMKNKIILIQGAMDIEIQYLIDQLNEVKPQTIAGYKFYEGTFNNIKVIVSKTQIGTINSSVATTIGITTFYPDIIINQGIAGAHRVNLHTGDIIIGEQCANINSYSMPCKCKGQGSNPFEWKPNKRARDIQSANSQLVDVIYNNLITSKNNIIIKGILGSGDLFSREFDRIIWINSIFENDCEDMESIGTYTVCNKFNIPCIGIRVISNNELLQEPLDKEKAIDLQKLLISILHKL